MPPRPREHASRATFRRYYQATTDAALAEFLTSRGPRQPLPPADSTQDGGSDMQSGAGNSGDHDVDTPEDRETRRNVRPRLEPEAVVGLDVDQDIEPLPENQDIGHLLSDLVEANDEIDRDVDADGLELSDNDAVDENPPPQAVEQPADPFVSLGTHSTIENIRITAEFINSLRHATLDASNMKPEAIEYLREASPDLPFDVEDPDFLFSLRTFLSVTNASQETYHSIRAAAMARHPEDEFFSFDQMKRRVEMISGVSPIVHDMCVDSCAAFTGPFSELDACPFCSEDRYHTNIQTRAGERVPRRQFHTIPIGPVIQALYRSPKTAVMMQYRSQETRRILDYLDTHGGRLDMYNDTYCGQEYLDAVRSGKIKDDDIVLQLSFDSAQLYRDKSSDCWIYVFIIHNLSPLFRYLKTYVAPGGFAGGPNKPKHSDSFMWPGLYHISALQKEGLRIWNAATNSHVVKAIPFLGFNTADGVAMAEMTGMVGHQGKHGCRMYCGIPGRRPPNDNHYYPAMLKPVNYTVKGGTHDDVTFQKLHNFRWNITQRYNNNLAELVAAPNPTRFKAIRLKTGLTKPTILSGLMEEHILGVPKMNLLDIMHLVTLNDPDLMIGLWRGTIKCYLPDTKATWDWAVLKGAVWDAHGQTVALATSFIPSSFDRAPRNPADKINSGYKAWEFLLYIFGLGPALFHSILPEKYWRNYCKLVRGVHLLQQRSISAAQLTEGTMMLCKFVREFEELYYQRRPERLHFVRHSIHLLTHMGPETVRIGPMACYAQWTMETMIGNLGQEIRQDRDPYANISQRGILRAQLNSMRAIIPNIDLRTKDKLPRGAVDLGGGYALLRACQKTPTDVTEVESDPILRYWTNKGWENQDGWTRTVKRWARLSLPNGQIARSLWYESRSKRNLRRTRNVKIRIQGNSKSEFAEVQYFFRLRFGPDEIYSLALVSLFSDPDLELLKLSEQTVYACNYQSDQALQVIDIKVIDSVVAFFPFYKVTPEGRIEVPDAEYVLVEKPGLDIATLLGQEDEEDFDEHEEDDDDDLYA